MVPEWLTSPSKKSVDAALEALRLCRSSLLPKYVMDFQRRNQPESVLDDASEIKFAAKEGDGKPGLGGYCHGLYWRLPLSDRAKELPIAATEKLAKSKNSKVVVIGPGGNGMPVILGDDRKGK